MKSPAIFHATRRCSHPPLHCSFFLTDDIASAELLSAAAKSKTKSDDVLANIISMENCTNVMLVADEINNSRLREACLHFGIKNINRIPGKSSMLYSSSTLMMLLQSFTRQPAASL